MTRVTFLKKYWLQVVCTILTIVTAALAIVYFFYSNFFHDSFTCDPVDCKSCKCPPSEHQYFLFANLFHFTILLTGIAFAFLIYKIYVQDRLKEKFCIALLAFVAFFAYEIIDYDPIHLKWCHCCPGIPNDIKVEYASETSTTGMESSQKIDSN